MYFPCIYPNPNKLLSLALTVMITNTPKYGWRRCDVHMNIDTVLYIDILNRQFYRVEEISLKIFTLLKVIEDISPTLNPTTSCQVAHKASLRIFIHLKIKSALSAKKGIVLHY